MILSVGDKCETPSVWFLRSSINYNILFGIYFLNTLWYRSIHIDVGVLVLLLLKDMITNSLHVYAQTILSIS